MYYRASDPTVSTRDWFRLNVNSIPADLLQRNDSDIDDPLIEEVDVPCEPEDPDWNEVPDMKLDSWGVAIYSKPDASHYEDTAEGAEAFEADVKTWETYQADLEKYLETREREAFPMWSTYFHVEDGDERIREWAKELGLRIYQHQDVEGDLLGVDGAGFNFYDAFWIPLRARIAAWQTREDRESNGAIYTLLCKEARQEGPTDVYLSKIFAA